ncbi:MAG: iron ABC transporter substrate-binding protein [Desulfurivibrionaceae bacterium]|nr:iron ABC transporter substrate-binding protein [Desulfurivibrionaceae bacterium]
MGSGLPRFFWMMGCLLLLLALVPQVEAARTITDAAGRRVTIADQVERVICSGPGCLRLLTYLQAQDCIVAVDSIEQGDAPIDARPYAIANPQFATHPLFGQFRGRDNPELIVALQPQPQVIFKTYAGQDGDRLQAKTGIPVITLEYGNLTYGRPHLEHALRLMAAVLGREERAEKVLSFFTAMEEDLRRRTSDIPAAERPSCYVGGLGQRGPQGFQSTEPSFAPFVFTGTDNIAASAPGARPLSHAMVAKELIVRGDPQVIFVDLSTIGLAGGSNALAQLRDHAAYQSLAAVRSSRVYGLFPYNSYTQNFETIFANAYYVGKVLYPHHFADIEPLARAEEISLFLNGARAFARLQVQYGGLPFSRLGLR